MNGMQYGVYRCEVCGVTKPGELPPLWSGMDLWPNCCQQDMNLHCALVDHAKAWLGVSQTDLGRDRLDVVG